MTYHLAQYNLARLKAPLGDPLIADFVAALDPLNKLAEEFDGFVWRHQDESGNSTSIRVRGDPMILINFSVWRDIESLFQYAYRSEHADIYRRRREFFHVFDGAYAVLWWIPQGHIPSVNEGEDRLNHLRSHGPTAHAFTFKSRFPPPAA